MKRHPVRVIYWAFLLSLCAHFALAPLAQHFKFADAAKEVPEGKIIVERWPKPTPPPSPPPTPKPREQPRQTAQSKPSVVPHPILPNTKPASGGHSRNGRRIATTGTNPGPGTITGTGTEVATASPAPTPTPKPVCSAPYVEATTVVKDTPEMPEAARDAGLTGTTQVKVDLSAGGTVEDASVALSSGSSILDAAAIRAAKRTTYTPKVVDCHAVPGSYLFRVEFDNN